MEEVVRKGKKRSICSTKYLIKEPWIREDAEKRDFMDGLMFSICLIFIVAPSPVPIWMRAWTFGNRTDLYQEGSRSFQSRSKPRQHT